MYRTKKTAGLLLAALTLLAGLTGTALAAEGATLAVSSAEADPGESVALTLSLTDNPGYAAFNFSVDFDESRLEMTEFKLTSTAGALSMASASTHAATYASLNEKTGDGALATMTFRVRDDAPAGAAAVTLKDVGFFRADESRITVSTSAGSVTVGGELPAEPDAADDPAQPDPAAQPDTSAKPDTPDAPAEGTSAAADVPTPEALPPEGPGESGLPVKETTAVIDPAAQAREELDPAKTAVYVVDREEGSSSSDSGFETVTVPFPEGKTGDDRSYRAYLVTEDGGLEELFVTETAAGLSVVTDPELPIAVTWEEKGTASSPTPAAPEPTPEPTPGEIPGEAPSAAPVPDTAAKRSSGGVAVAAGIGAVAVAAVAVVLLVRRKRG